MPPSSQEMTSPEMKYPQFINGHCVVCFEEEETCRADFEKFGRNRKNFMAFPIIPLKIWDLQIEKARFNIIYNWKVPEHNWFRLFSTTGKSDFSIEQEYWNRATIEEETYYKEMLIQKWTSASRLLIESIIDFEIYRHARNLWGVSPIDQHEWELATLKERKRMEAYKANFADDDTTEASSESPNSSSSSSSSSESSDSDATVALQQLMDSEETSDSDYMEEENEWSVATPDFECAEDHTLPDSTSWGPSITITIDDSEVSDEEDGPSPPKRRVPDWLRELDFSSNSNESEGWRSFTSSEECE